MDKKEYSRAENYWKTYDEASLKMERNAIWTFADKYLSEHSTCVLATGYNDFVRCTPIEYTWINHSFYLLSEGGMKFKALSENKNVSLAIFESYKGFRNIASIVVTGKAELIEYDNEEYHMLLEHKKIPKDAIQKLTHPMYLIKVIPEAMELLFSEFKASGFDLRQQLTF